MHGYPDKSSTSTLGNFKKPSYPRKDYKFSRPTPCKILKANITSSTGDSQYWSEFSDHQQNDGSTIDDDHQQHWTNHSSSTTPIVPTIPQGCYITNDQLMMLMNKNNCKNTHTSPTINSSRPTSHSVNMGCLSMNTPPPQTQSSGKNFTFKQSLEIFWVINNGSTDHMCGPNYSTKGDFRQT